MATKKELLQEGKELGLDLPEGATNAQLQEAINTAKKQPLVEKAVELGVSPPVDATPTEVKRTIKESEEGVALAQASEPVEEVQVERIPDPNFDPNFVPAERGDILSFGTTPGDVYPQKSVLYTDGLGRNADQNLERAYEIPEVLQTNNPKYRESGDESLSEAARMAKSDKEKRIANNVTNRDDDPASRSALNKD